MTGTVMRREHDFEYPRYVIAWGDGLRALTEFRNETRRGVLGAAQHIGAVFDAAVREGWTYLGELARKPMFPPSEWDELVTSHVPPNLLLVAADARDNVIGFAAVHPQAGEMYFRSPRTCWSRRGPRIARYGAPGIESRGLPRGVSLHARAK
jgi:hypothetical protein